ncbi:hypothetical protein POI8812_01035 [Pontivivens insulae]|uniref:Uncharacterized protein n=1 Tax=Pontivivens insulae TaxID=1639689 RepID=A0A2R8A933_9RHOB|nr:hypothetical protein DFR53_1034 [Pontivivens insulae]SPF28732.1 hypothetical protein POI8812_01035 [Pontivivens insulae]
MIFAYWMSNWAMQLLLWLTVGVVTIVVVLAVWLILTAFGMKHRQSQRKTSNWRRN